MSVIEPPAPTDHESCRDRPERLDRLAPGHCGIITEFEAGEAEVEQLKSMGVCVGRRVMLVAAGDPLILKVMGSRIGVSARLAAKVQVEACHGDSFGALPSQPEDPVHSHS